MTIEELSSTSKGKASELLPAFSRPLWKRLEVWDNQVAFGLAPLLRTTCRDGADQHVSERENHETAGAHDAGGGVDARRRLREGTKRFAAGSRVRAYRRAERRAEGEGTWQGALRAPVANERFSLRR